jgi:hypothetical protein
MLYNNHIILLKHKISFISLFINFNDKISTKQKALNALIPVKQTYEKAKIIINNRIISHIKIIYIISAEPSRTHYNPLYSFKQPSTI